MTPEEQAAADAAAKVAAAGAQDGGTAKDAAYWEREAKKAFDARDKANEKVKTLSPLAEEGQKALDAKKTAEERLVEALSQIETHRTRADKATAAMESRLALEIAAIPEAMRGLVPASLDPADQLEWIAKAHAAGAFGKQRSTSAGAEIPDGRGATTVTRATLSQMAPSERAKFFKDGGRVSD